ncbi:hypothetical protein ACQ86E_16530 [Bradyrhizobium betae]|jgi:hypothetical protein|uniref:hypothetical protein n=1 Tax=Bradyrhizobium betae TaxID=244734 RepID=UPI003D670FC5
MTVRRFGRAALILQALGLAAVAPAMAQMPNWDEDRTVCSQLAGNGGGLFVLYPPYATIDPGLRGGQLNDGRRFVRVNGTPLPYQTAARFFYFPNGGAIMRPGEEAVWSVRTETVETPDANYERFKAKFVTLWRPGIKTKCSPNVALETFTSFEDRNVTLYKYAEHHPIDPTDTLSRSAKIRNRLHMDVELPGCPSTDDTAVSGPNRWDAYGFEKIPDDPRLIKTIFKDPNSVEATQSIGRGNERRAAYTMEFTIATGQPPAAPACFGFTVPIPVKSSFWSGGPVMGLEEDWRPHLTKIRFRKVPGSNLQPVSVLWKAR